MCTSSAADNLTCELHVARKKGHRLRPTIAFGTGGFLTFQTFPETGSVEDSRNSRNKLRGGGGGGVETGREIWVSVEQWCY